MCSYICSANLTRFRPYHDQINKGIHMSLANISINMSLANNLTIKSHYFCQTVVAGRSKICMSIRTQMQPHHSCSLPKVTNPTDVSIKCKVICISKSHEKYFKYAINHAQNRFFYQRKKCSSLPFNQIRRELVIMYKNANEDSKLREKAKKWS